MRAADRSPSLPELVFAIAGPIGVDVPAIADTLANALRVVRYESAPIHLTSEMTQYPPSKHNIQPPVGNDYHKEVTYKIDYANALCEEAKDSATLARIAIRAIARKRAELTGQPPDIETSEVTFPQKPTAYIIRQLKRPEEVTLLRKVYGKQFVLISAYGPTERRTSLVEDKIRRSTNPATAPHEINCLAQKLLARDSSEEDHDFGQRIRDTFHLADVFIDGLSKQEMENKLTRFIQAFFGRTDIAPSKDEYGMYAAKSASLRSADLSRQVGAAIFTDDGELVTQGCNEAPKALGGTYWDLEEPDFRDIKIGYDPNEILKKEILRDTLHRLMKANLLSQEATDVGAVGELVDRLTHKRKSGTEDTDGPLARSAIMDLTEFGRIVHAEMCAICDAARLGRSIKGCTLYCTTFPCHNCTKHILAAGIKRVVYIEPYPKSRAKDLHRNEIEIESDAPGRVSFVPFLGISPYRYRDIFQKEKRKNSDGSANRWISGTPKPLIDTITPTYPELEVLEYSKLFDTNPSTEQTPATSTQD